MRNPADSAQQAPALPKSRYAFLTLPNYSLIAVSNAVEPLRMANRVAGQAVYEWAIVSQDGRPVLASSGLDLAPIITHHFPVEEYEAGFAAMLSGQSGKVILDWS